MNLSLYRIYLGNRLPVLLGGLVTAIGALTIAGWYFDIIVFRSLADKMVAMNPVTALCFIFLGVSVIILYSNSADLFKKIAVVTLCGITAAIGLLTFLGYLFVIDFKIEQLFFNEKLSGNRIAPNTAINFFLIGLSILFLLHKGRVNTVISQVLALLSGLSSFLALLGYIFGVHTLYKYQDYIPMALNTAIGFIILMFASFSLSGKEGFIKIITSEYFGGLTARRLIPIAVILPVLYGFLRLKAEEAGLIIGAASGVALLSITIMFTFFVFIVVNAYIINRTDKLRHEAESGLIKALENVRHLYNSAPCGYHSVNKEGYIIEANNTLLSWLGYSREEFVGKMHYHGLYVSARKEISDTNFKELQKNGYVKELEMVLRRKDGSSFPAIINSYAVRDAEGNFIQSNTNSFDISARKNAENALYNLNRQLEESNKELESFSYSVSHDLRAPLRHIIGFSEKLENISPDFSDEQKRLLGKIAGSAERMGRLIDDLLMFSRTGRTELIKINIDTSKLVDEIIEQYRTSANKIHIKVDRLPGIKADKTLIRLVFENLISNAVKYSSKKDNTEIDIGCQSDNSNESVFYIKDNGAGFDMSYAGKLFNVFQRLHRDDEYEGTGIGLATVKRIISRHGGRTWANAEVNKGAAFYFSLPKN